MRWLRALTVLLSVLMTSTSVLVTVADAPANADFERAWARTDQPVLAGQANRTWMWGPEAFTGAVQEPYAESPGGQRGVQYFDKARMEISDPGADPASIWYVTNGLLVVELISGSVQTGNASFEPRQPAAVNVAGDGDDPDGPTYASFAAILDQPPHDSGQTVTQRLDRAGNLSDDAGLAGQAVTVALVDEVTNHAIAAPFWTFMTSSGLVYEAGQYLTAPLFENPYFATGRPISEPVWATVRIGGTPRDVLIQCFERRCLTYTPGNSEGFVVEAGNVGRHYYQWRYEDDAPAPGMSDALAHELLATLDDTPDNVALFNSGIAGGTGVYPDGPPMVPASGPELTEVGGRAELTSEFAYDPLLQGAVLAMYDDPAVAERIPHPAARAAFASLLGYPSGPFFVDFFLNSGAFTRISFEVPLTDGVFAEAVTCPCGGTYETYIVFNERYLREDFRHWIPIIPHELGHEGGPVSGYEEALLHAFQATYYLQVLERHPEMARQGTELARRNNSLALAFLHSRQPEAARVSLIAPDGAGVYPGSPNFDFRDFLSLFPDAVDTLGSPMLVALLEQLLADGAPIPEDVNYSLETIQLFDAHHDLSKVGLDDRALLRLGVLLQWYDVDEIATAAGMTPETVIAALELEPVLAAIAGG